MPTVPGTFGDSRKAAKNERVLTESHRWQPRPMHSLRIHLDQNFPLQWEILVS